jgi:hypothetical protein
MNNQYRRYDLSMNSALYDLFVGLKGTQTAISFGWWSSASKRAPPHGTLGFCCENSVRYSEGCLICWPYGAAWGMVVVSALV